MLDDVGRAITARLNDMFRFTGDGGWIFLTAGVAELPVPTKDAIVNAVRLFYAFTPENDPHGEHDCALLTVEKHRIIWKIDYYRRGGIEGDVDPTDPSTTRRVLTIMLAEEY